MTNWKMLQPLTLASKTSQNRIVMAAHSYGYVDHMGLPTQYLIDYLLERARGGVGLVIMGGTAVSHTGSLTERIMVNGDDSIIPWYQRISNELHKYGTLVIDQLMHVGGQLDACEGLIIKAPSAIPHEVTKGIPDELNISEIEQIIEDFARAAERAKMGGLDGIEIKGDQGFLVHQFLSPYYNRRNDEYGGDATKRLKFLDNLIKAIRNITGSDFIIGVRITGDSFTPDDISLEDAVNIARGIEQTEQVNYIHVNAATNSSFLGYLINHGDSSIPSMNFTQITRTIKNVVGLPVIAASMILHPSEAEHVLERGIADMVAMTRAHIADPEIVKKVKENRIEDIRPCVLCNQGCVGNHWKGQDVRCIHNPATGREAELGYGTLIRATTNKSVGVIGGGPAGLELARIAASRGHHVELFEKQEALGGQLVYASRIPYRQGLLDIINYLEQQITRLGVKIYRGVEVKIEELLAVEPFDITVVATGSKAYIPPIYSKIPTSSILTTSDLLRGDINIGDNILVVDRDWRQNPLGITEFLVQKKKQVTIISSTYYVGEGLDASTWTSHYSRIHSHAKLLPLTELVSLEHGTALLRNVLSNELQEVYPIDQVVFVTGARPISYLYDSLLGKVPSVFRVGDCMTPLGIPEAMLAANRLARTF